MVTSFLSSEAYRAFNREFEKRLREELARNGFGKWAVQPPRKMHMPNDPDTAETLAIVEMEDAGSYTVQ